jgi:hypothetical protein
MRCRHLSLALLLALGHISTHQAKSGEWLKKCKADFHRAYYLNRAWPEPYVGPDRMAVRAPFAVMVSKGWQDQNTLTGDHFESEGIALSETGRLKVADVLVNSPPQYRTIFIEKSWGDGPTTPQRVKAVEDYVNDRMPEFAPVSVAETLRQRPWTAGDMTDNTLRQWQATQPTPRLPASTGATMGTAGGSGGGAPGTGN